MSTLEATPETSPRVSARPVLAWAGLMALTLAYVYAPVLRDLWYDWAHDDNYSHGFLVPLISAYLLWGRRADLRATPLRRDLRALLLVIPSLALLLLGTAGAEYFLQRASLVGMLGGLLWFACGPGWARIALFPVAFLLFAVPVPYVLYYSLSFPLQQLAARVAAGALTLIGISAVRVGNTIELPNSTLEVAEACSGLRSLVSLLALGALFARYTQDRPWKRWVLFASTIPIAILGNALRVFCTGLGVYLGGPRWAEGTVHEAMGLVVFAFALASLLVLSALMRGVRLQPAPPPVDSP